MVLLKGKGQLPIFSFCAGYGDGSFLILCRSLHRPTPVRCNWSVFARKMRSTTKFAMTILSKCVCVDHLHRCKTSFGCSRFSCFNIRFAGGTGPLWIPVPTKLFHNGGSGD